MKRKPIIVLAVCLLFALLCACGGGQSSDNTSSESGTQSSSNNASGDSVDLGEAIIIEDDYATVKATRFYYEDRNGEPTPCFEATVTNNLDRELLFNINPVYLGDEEISLVMRDGNSGPLPGKTNHYRYWVLKADGNEQIPMDSLNDLFGINGKISISVFSEDKSVLEGDKDREYLFDMSEIK